MSPDDDVCSVADVVAAVPQVDRREVPPPAACCSAWLHCRRERTPAERGRGGWESDVPRPPVTAGNSFSESTRQEPRSPR